MALFKRLFKKPKKAKSRVKKIKIPKKIKPKIKIKKVVKVKKRILKPKIKKIAKPKKIVKRPVVKKIKKPKIVKPAAPRPIIPKPLLIEKMPDEKAFELLKRYRIPTVQQLFCKKEKDLPQILKKIGFPCVMKVSGPIIHKTDIGGVKTNIQSIAQATETFKQLMKIKHAEKVIIQKQISGIEMIVGAKHDPSFGSVVTAGIGGIYVEVLKDVVFRVCPITVEDAQKMVAELKGIDILKGIRGTKAISFDALYDIILKLCKLAVNEEIKEMDINPLICNEQGCLAVDVRIVK